MKILKNISLIFLLVSFISCSKEENSITESTFENLTGKWEVTSYSYEGTTSYRAINTNDSWNTSYHAEAWLLDFYLEVNENPNDYSLIGTHKIDYFYTDENGNEYYYVGDQTKNEIGTYVRNSNSNITFTEGNLIKHGIIIQLDSFTLEINVSDTSSETNSDNILVTRIKNENYIFKRVD